MTRGREERNRVLGFPVGRHPNTRPAKRRGDRPAGERDRPAGERDRPAGERDEPSGERQDQPAARRQPETGEPQRVLGFSADWVDEFAGEVLRPLLRRIRGRGRR